MSARLLLHSAKSCKFDLIALRCLLKSRYLNIFFMQRLPSQSSLATVFFTVFCKKRINYTFGMMSKLLISLMLFVTLEAGVEHKLVFLISPPRSLSTVFTRMMYERGDFAIMHEPSLAAYCTAHAPSSDFLKMFKEGTPKNYSAVRDRIYEMAACGPVFAKEISFSAEEFFESNEDFFTDPNVYFVFLVRHPHSALISYYKKLQGVPAALHEWVGYQNSFNIFRKVNDISPNKPFIILTESLSPNPDIPIRAMCEALKIPYKEEALHWADLGDDFTGEKEWAELKHKEFFYYWHSNAISSKGFEPLTSYDFDQDGQPTFSEVCDLGHRQALIDLYHKNLPYYEALKSFLPPF